MDMTAVASSPFQTGYTAPKSPSGTVSLLDLQIGSEVHHKAFGRGQVSGIFGSGIIEIEFADGTIKRFFRPDLERLGVLTVVT